MDRQRCRVREYARAALLYSVAVSHRDAAPPTQPVARLYADHSRVRHVIQALRSAGVPADAISVLSRSTVEADNIERTTGVSDDLEDAAIRRHPLSDFVDWLGRIEAVAVPGFGAVLGTGNLWQDVALGARKRGAITGALVGVGIPVDDAKHFEEAVLLGDLLLVIHGPDLGMSHEQVQSMLDTP